MQEFASNNTKQEVLLDFTITTHYNVAVRIAISKPSNISLLVVFLLGNVFPMNVWDSLQTKNTSVANKFIHCQELFLFSTTVYSIWKLPNKLEFIGEQSSSYLQTLFFISLRYTHLHLFILKVIKTFRLLQSFGHF